MKKWYAVYVNSRHEKKVAALFDIFSIENYLPVQKVLKQWSDRKKIVEEPLFRSYVFAHVDETEKEAVRRVDGVLNFVYWLGQPAVIRDEEIAVIKRFMGEYENIQVEHNTPQLNSSVKIDGGPFMNHIGKVIKVGKNKVKVIIESLGCSLIADVPVNKIVNLPVKLKINNG
ncbi:MAG: transcription termination/antitermination protein NusG [Bacteroidia bacterium]